MAIQFDRIDELKRDREIEGNIGVSLRVFDDVYLEVLCQSDANPGYRMFGASKLRDVKRHYNAGATPEEMDGHWANYFFDTRVVKGWHGVVFTPPSPAAEEGAEAPPPPRPVAIPFTRDNWVAWAKAHPRALKMVEVHTNEETNFRARSVERAGDAAKN